MKYSIRDILLSMVIVGMGIGWYFTKRNETLLKQQLQELEDYLTVSDDIVVGFAKALRSHGMEYDFHAVPAAKRGNGPVRIESVTIHGGCLEEGGAGQEP